MSKIFNRDLVPLSGLSGEAFCLKANIPVISISAKSISRLPSSCLSIFRIQNSLNPWELTCVRSRGWGKFSSSSSRLSYEDHESVEHPDDLRPPPAPLPTEKNKARKLTLECTCFQEFWAHQCPKGTMSVMKAARHTRDFLILRRGSPQCFFINFCAFPRFVFTSRRSRGDGRSPVSLSDGT